MSNTPRSRRGPAYGSIIAVDGHPGTRVVVLPDIDSRRRDPQLRVMTLARGRSQAQDPPAPERQPRRTQDASKRGGRQHQARDYRERILVVRGSYITHLLRNGSGTHMPHHLWGQVMARTISTWFTTSSALAGAGVDKVEFKLGVDEDPWMHLWGRVRPGVGGKFDQTLEVEGLQARQWYLAAQRLTFQLAVAAGQAHALPWSADLLAQTMGASDTAPVRFGHA